MCGTCMSYILLLCIVAVREIYVVDYIGATRVNFVRSYSPHVRLYACPDSNKKNVFSPSLTLVAAWRSEGPSFSTPGQMACTPVNLLNSTKTIDPPLPPPTISLQLSWNSPAAWVYLALHGSYGVLWVAKVLRVTAREAPKRQQKKKLSSWCRNIPLCLAPG